MTDSEIVAQAMEVLGLSQEELGELLGKSQSAISWVVTRGTRLSELDKKEIRRALARHEAVQTAINQGTIAGPIAVPECAVRINLEVGPDEWLQHAMECPSCALFAMAARERLAASTLA